MLNKCDFPQSQKSTHQDLNVTSHAIMNQFICLWLKVFQDVYESDQTELQIIKLGINFQNQRKCKLEQKNQEQDRKSNIAVQTNKYYTSTNMYQLQNQLWASQQPKRKWGKCSVTKYSFIHHEGKKYQMLTANMFFRVYHFNCPSFSFLIFIITATKYLVSRVDVEA